MVQWAEAQCDYALYKSTFTLHLHYITVRTDRNGLPERRGSISGSAGRFHVRISGAHALRLISRAGKEGSTVSSIICDR